MPILSAFGALKSFGAQGRATSYAANFNNASYCEFSTSSLSPGTNDFSVEFFINQTSTPVNVSGFGDCVFDAGYRIGTGFNRGMRIWVQQDLTIYVQFYDPIGGGNTIISSSSITLGTWYYVGLSRVSGTTRLFIGSSQVGSNANITNSLEFTDNRFGAGIYTLSTNYLNAKVASFRLNVGSGFSTATVPTGPLSATAQTKILTFQSSTLNNQVGGGAPSTNTGVTVVTTGPF